MVNTILLIASAVITLYSAGLYAADTLRGRAQPNRVTWFLWALAPLIAFAAQVSVGVGLQTLLTLSVGLGPLLVLAASFYAKHAKWAIGPFDIACGLLSILALVLWVITGSGLLALSLSLLADFLAALPTVIKAFRHPETESPKPFFIAAFGATLTIVTVSNWQFETYAFGIYILCINLVIAGLAIRKQS